MTGWTDAANRPQTELLATCLRQEGIPVKQITFPTYTRSSAPIELYLSGELGALDEVNVYAASTFYAVDRYASFCRDWGSDYNAGRLVLTDRYVTANVIHQMGKLPRERWEDYLEWLSDLEYTRFGLPRRDVVFYLELPLETADALLAGRYAGQQHGKRTCTSATRPTCASAVRRPGLPRSAWAGRWCTAATGPGASVRRRTLRASCAACWGRRWACEKQKSRAPCALARCRGGA